MWFGDMPDFGLLHSRHSMDYNFCDNTRFEIAKPTGLAGNSPFSVSEIEIFAV